MSSELGLQSVLQDFEPRFLRTTLNFKSQAATYVTILIVAFSNMLLFTLVSFTKIVKVDFLNGQAAAGVPWHGQYPQSPRQQPLTLNGKSISQGYDSSALSSRVGTNPMSAIQVGPDMTPHVASNFHSVLPRKDVQEHFKRTNSVTIGGNTADAPITPNVSRSSIDQRTIFGPQGDQLFRRSKYPPPSPSIPQQSQLGTNLQAGQSPIRQTNLSTQTTLNIPGRHIMTSRASSAFQQSSPRNIGRY